MFDGFPRSVIEWLVDEYIVNMSNAERNRLIMKRRFLDGITFERLGEEFSMSDWQVKHIVKICCDTLRNV
jgi:6-phosphogluconolactonase/glucosamine-6-phosphate isomerase/deaminase